MGKELASRFNLEGALDYATIINGRTAERYRAEIRLRFGFREATVNDADMLTDWLRDHAVADAYGDFEKLVAIFELRCRELAIEPPKGRYIVLGALHPEITLDAHPSRFTGRNPWLCAHNRTTCSLVSHDRKFKSRKI